MRFSYKARTKEGELQIGSVEASAKEAAADVLIGHGLFVLSLDEVREGGSLYDRLTAVFRRVKTADLMVFTRQFATLLAAQVTLSDGLTSLYHQTTNPILKEAIAAITHDVEGGSSLSQAIAMQGNIFSEFYVNMIRSAEVTGRLSEVLDFLADYLEDEAALISKVKSALTYPIFVVGLFFAVIVIMVTYVFPQLTPIFKESSIALPFYTRVILDAGAFIAEWWWAVAIIIGLFGLMIFDYVRTPEGKVVLDEVLLKMPIVGPMFRKVYIARFAESARVLIKGGLTIPQAIEISSRTIGNTVYQELLHRAADQVRKGRLLSQALSDMPEFPPLVSQLVGVGESTGRLEGLLSKVNLFYTREVNDTVDNLVNLLQPILMVVIGGLVALLFAAILLPLYNLSQSIGG